MDKVSFFNGHLSSMIDLAESPASQVRTAHGMMPVASTP